MSSKFIQIIYMNSHTTNMECKYCKILEKENFGDLLLETRHWIVFLAPNQSLIGTCVLALNRHLENLSGLELEEWQDFAFLVKRMEHTLKGAFNATMFNWGCLMNASYLKNPPEPHLHWHLIPRYNHEVKLNGLTFEDVYFGHMKPQPIKNISLQTRKIISDKIRENL
ncbi:diadenosine tetraphosphate (Ap4A) HIT family hydrolase [Methanobacterium aggregans]|nr:diadenosine tetraphosphate (Ap4A) HIT family hydrolase [Methanobacterium aggregans]